MKKIKFFKRVSMALLGLNLLVQPIQAATVSVEEMYDSKIKAIQQLPNTYVIGTEIVDINNDGVKDLVIGLWELEEYSLYNVVKTIVYTYKEGKICKLNDEILAYVDGSMHYPDTIISIVKKGNQSMIKFDAIENRGWGVHTRTTIYYTLDKDNKLKGYLKRYSYDDRAGDNIVGQKVSYFKEGQKITQAQYDTEKKLFNSENILYRASSVVPSAHARADKYNPESSEKEIHLGYTHGYLTYENTVQFDDNWGL